MQMVWLLKLCQWIVIFIFPFLLSPHEEHSHNFSITLSHNLYSRMAAADISGYLSMPLGERLKLCIVRDGDIKIRPPCYSNIITQTELVFLLMFRKVLEIRSKFSLCLNLQKCFKLDIKHIILHKSVFKTIKPKSQV